MAELVLSLLYQTNDRKDYGFWELYPKRNRVARIETSLVQACDSCSLMSACLPSIIVTNRTMINFKASLSSSLGCRIPKTENGNLKFEVSSPILPLNIVT